MNSIHVGQKIRRYRTNKGVSQFDLETMIDASPGSLSKIENGVTNPTKETIFAVIEALKLDVDEAAYLFGIDLKYNYEKYQKIYNELPVEMGLDTFVNYVVNGWTKQVGALYASFWLWDEASLKLKLQNFSASNKAFEFTIKILKVDVQNVYFSESNPEHSGNLILETFLRNKPIINNSFYEIGRPFSGINSSKVLEKFLGMKSAIHLPIRLNGKAIGVIGWIWPEEEISDIKLNELMFIVNQIAREIYYIKRINFIEKKLNS